MASPINKLMVANLRHHASRYISTAIAITISATFVVLSLALVGGVTQQYMSTIEDSTQGSAAVVSWELDPQADDSNDLAAQNRSQESIKKAIEQVEGVSKVVESPYTVTRGSGGGSTGAAITVSTADTYLYASTSMLPIEAHDRQLMMRMEYVQSAPLHTPTVIEGKLPKTATEIALEQNSADTLKVKVGDSVEVGDSALGTEVKDYKVSAIIAGSKFRSGALYVTQKGYENAMGTSTTSSFLVVPRDSSLYSPRASQAAQKDFVDKVKKAVSQHDGEAKQAGLIYTTYSSARLVDDGRIQAKTISGAMTASSLIFPLIAAFVAAIIVGTTFQVIALQRRRELALLRAVGAQARQVRSLIFRETSLAGMISSLIGVAVGALAGAGLLMYLDVAPTYFIALAMLPWKWLGVTWVGASLISIFVGLTPARKASSVSPLAALSPVQSVEEEKRNHWVRSIFGVVLLIISIVGIVYGLKMGNETENEIFARFGIVVLSTVGCWIAVMILFTVVLPRIIYWCGAFVRTPVGRLARENVVRNPGRTASTGIAVIIGVVLMTTISVGVASVRSTLHNTLDISYPIDLSIESAQGTFSKNQLSKLENFKFADKYIESRGAIATIPGSEDTPVGKVIGLENRNAISHSKVSVVDDGTVHVNPNYSLAEKSTVTLCVLPDVTDISTLIDDPAAVASASKNAVCKDFSVVKDDKLMYGQILISANDLKDMAPNAPVSLIDFRLKSTAGYEDVVEELSKINDISMNGGFLTRGVYDQILNIIAAVFLALLGVAVVISLVGVANTLGLSVVERTRENGLLRALGLSRGQMKLLLVWESFLTSFISTIVGMILGTIFAIIGMHVLPFDDLAGGIRIAFDIPQMIGLLAVIVLASVLAAWLPGRKAAKVSPVEALAHE